ncbi:MAG TPA: C-type lectin domain-containing protein [Polyangiaceae bacterium]|nr:C-type lectin domain-containing protein [Polyangiaceae bacterium]
MSENGGSPGSGATSGSGGASGGTGNGGGGGTGGIGAGGGASDSGTTDGASDAGSGTGGANGAGGANGSGGATSCGNGVVDPGEECDTSGASASCDTDCSFASCGDGTLNATAGEQCDSRDSAPSCGANCKVETCRAGCTCEWYFGKRYMYCPDKLNSTPATAACVSFGMRTVRITSGQEASFLRLRSQVDAYGKFHIGASDSANEGVWIWEDGTQFWSGAAAGTPVGGKFSFWASGEPNNQGGVENCGEIQSIQGWNDSRCDFEAKPFVCKQYRDPRPTCGNGKVEAGEACDTTVASPSCDADCSPVVCGDGTVNAAAGEACDDAKTGQYCSADCKSFVCPSACQCFPAGGGSYALCTAPASFRDAAVECGRHGMALAQLPSAIVDQAIRTEVTSRGVGEYWVGGLDLDAEGQWMWTSTVRFWSGAAAGTALAYAHFAPGAPAGGNTMNCLRVLANGTWSDTDCANTLPSVCERLAP